MNTTDNIGKPTVRRVADLPEHEVAQLQPHRPDRPEDHRHTVTVGNLYDVMESADDPVPMQRIPAPGLHVFKEGDTGAELQRVDHLVVFSDGTLFAEIDEEVVDPDEVEGFIGFLMIEEPLRSEEDAKSAFEKTRL